MIRLNGLLNFGGALKAVECVDYTHPPIPDGYRYLKGKPERGFTIIREVDGSQFTWVTVRLLPSDGTLDGEHFNSQFGRRNFRNDPFSDEEFHEEVDAELLEQIESIDKYGGYYISSYKISKSEGRPLSQKGCEPWTNICRQDAEILARSMERREMVTSHLTYGAEHDSALRLKLLWNIRSWDDLDDMENGKTSEDLLCALCDNEDQVRTWTKENYWKVAVTRGAVKGHYEGFYPEMFRNQLPPNFYAKNIGFNVVLCCK